MVGQNSIKMLFGGDFSPRDRYAAVIEKHKGGVFGEARHAIEQADFSAFNLEAPLCVAATPIEKAGPRISADPATLEALSDAGVAAVGLANNHIFDYGRDGLSQTLSNLEKYRIGYFGAGLDRESAEAPLRLDIKGRKISVFSFAEREFNVSDDGEAGAALLDPIVMGPLIVKERAQADAIIVCVHGGKEYFPYPPPGFRRICQFLVDIGADAVVGHHPHVAGPYEIYKGKPIFYSLGNLIFDKLNPLPGWDEGYFVDIDLNFIENRLKDIQIELIPYRQSVERGGLDVLEGAEKSAFLGRIEEMRSHLEIHPERWLSRWNGIVEKSRNQALIEMASPLKFPGLRRLLAARTIRNLIAPPSRQLHRLNLLRCDSHRELLIGALESLDRESRAGREKKVPKAAG